MGISRKVVVLISAMLLMSHKVSATSLSGSVSVSPRSGLKVVGGDEIVLNVNASLTSSDVLNDITLSLECTNAKPNSTTDIMALFSSTVMPTNNQVGNDEVKASFGSTSLIFGAVLEFSWSTLWFIPDTVSPASSITCDFVMSYENSSSLVESQILYSGILFVLAPAINLTNADGELFDGSSGNFADIGEEILIKIMAMVPQSNVELEVKIEPANRSADIAAATGLAITEASSRINCLLGFTGQQCRTKNQAVDPRGLSLEFYDGEVSIIGDISVVNDLELQAKIRVGDEGVSDDDRIQVDVSMTTGRSHIWISAVPYNISDNGESRATVLEVNPMMTTHSLYNGYPATMQVALRHASSSRASAKEIELHLITSPRTVYQGVAETSLLTESPVIDGSFVIFKLGDIDLFSSVELLINLQVMHNYQGAGVSKAVNLVQAVYKNDTHSTARGSSSLTDVQFQYVDEPALCKTPWQPFLSSCYYVNASSPVDIFDAAQICKDEGGSLAYIDSIFEERFLVEISPKDRPPFRFWVLRNLTFTHWLPGQPDAGTCHSLVVAGSYWPDGRDNGGMESTACTDLRYVICEITIDPPGEVKNQFHGIPQPGQALTDSWTCPCTDYTSFGPGCACCKSGAFTCAASGHQVCAQDSSQCPVKEFYDRSILFDGTGLRIACNNVDVSSSEPSCVFSHVPSNTWEAFPLFIGDVIAYHSMTDTLYSIGRDSKTYLEGRFNRSWSTTDWSVISSERWMAARDNGGLTIHSLVPSSDYTNGDPLAWKCG